jgi:hypothetical protein
MNKIIFPLQQRMRGAAVADLQDALQALLDRRVILRDDDAARRELTAVLQRERADQTFGMATTKLVSAVQEFRRLGRSGSVDAATAEAINGFLRDAGLLDQPPVGPPGVQPPGPQPPGPQPPGPRPRIVGGRVRRSDGAAVANAPVRAFHVSDGGPVRLGDDQTDADGGYTIHYEFIPGVGGIDLRLSVLDAEGKVVLSSPTIRGAKHLETVDLTLPVAEVPAATRRIEGQILLEHGLPAEQLKLRLYRLDFGGAKTLLNETTTLAGGRYAFTYDPGGRAASLAVWVVKGVGDEFPLSKPLNDISSEVYTGLNLVAPSVLQPLTAEYGRLAADLTVHVGTMSKLAEAKETPDRQDLTILNRETGWDARLIALAATTQRLIADPDIQLPADRVYGLLRAGLPSDKLMLAQVAPEVAEQALGIVRDAGIIELTDPQMAEFRQQFAVFTTRMALKAPAPGSSSTYGALLSTSGLSADAQMKFAPVYLRHTGDAAQLWEEARKAGLDEAQIGKLQLQGKLAFLAGNSDVMTARLMQKPIDDPAQLVEQDLDRPTAWITEILGQAGIPSERRNTLTAEDKTKLNAAIPTAYRGTNVDDRLETYAQDMARKVRLSYPTQVVGRLIERDEIKLPPARRQATVALMKKAANQGFRLGETPVEAFLTAHAELREGIGDTEFRSAQDQMKTLQRVYQITPSNDAIPVLMSLGMTSAFDVMAYREADFIELYTSRFNQIHGTASTWHKWYDGNWSGWESLGGVLSGGPAVSSWANGRLDLFVRGSDNALWHKWFDGNWSQWESLGGTLTSDPAAVSWGNGRIDVFARGTDNTLVHKWFNGNWSQWESLGGVLTSGPAVSSWANGRLDVFVRGTDNALWHKWFSAGWSGWESLGGVLTSDPAAVSWGNGRIDVFVRGTDNALWHKWFAGNWSAWESLGGTLSSGPDVSSWANGRLDVFVRGTDHALWHKWFAGNWSQWESLQGKLTSAPAAVSWDNGRIDVFVRGTESSPKPEGELVYRKAKQVSSVTYNLFTIARKLESEPPIAGMSAPVEIRDSVRNELIKQFPTMESLFGSMDFCECEHCRSVLSPAAYLVDLLQFVDIESGVWGNFLAHWKATHGNQDYPHKDQNGNPLKPYDVLVKRRPDLPRISLTCENTHTALPYIDIVNEILEYYVANGKLEEEAVHDTGAATTAELLAEPQNVIREAYDKVRDARYPLTLPFDLWIETARQFCNYFEIPLARILELFRPSDDLFAPGQAFDRSSIFMESLGLAPSEVAIFTDADPLGNDKWKELYGFPTVRPAIQNPTNAGHATLTVANADATKFRPGLICGYFDVSAGAPSAESKVITSVGAPDSGGAGRTLLTFSGVWVTAPDAGDLLVSDAAGTLSSAKTLSRRLGVTYREITEIVQTGFVNPKLANAGILYKLGISIHDARFYLDHKALLPQDPATLSTEDQKRRLEAEATSKELDKLAAAYTVTRASLEAAVQGIPLGDVLVLADPNAGCDFDLTTLRYANGRAADAIAYLRINLFTRLWRKLGWSIEDTDRALQAFLPKNTPFETAHLGKQPLKTALIYLAHLKALDAKVRLGAQNRIKLVTLWSDIPVNGKKPLYAQLFLTRSVLKSAPVFDHPLAQYLSAPGVKLKDHVLALQGSLGRSADDISRILVDAKTSLDTADLTLPIVSLLYRYGLLAKTLKLSVRELIALKDLSGLDPFTALHPDEPADTAPGVVPAKRAIELDHPFSQTLRFIEVAEEVKASGLRIEDLEYLLLHRFDAAGKYRPNAESMLNLLKTLVEGVRAIRAEHAVPADPGSLTEEVLRQTLGLALAPDVVESFLAMLNGTVEFTATRSATPANKLDPTAFADEPAIRQVSYNATRQEQKLTFRGVLFDTEKNAMKARLPKPADGNPHVPSALFDELLDDVQRQARSFFERQLQKQAANVQPAAGFLDAADFGLLFDRNLPLAVGETEQDRARKRKVKLAHAFLPFLQARLIRQFIVQTMTAQTGADPVLTESLLTDERMLGPRPLLDALVAAGERGVSADFFNSSDATGNRQATGASVADVDTSLKPSVDKDGTALNVAGSAMFEGYLEVPAPGAYRFHVALDKQNAEAELRFPHLTDPLLVQGAAPTDNAVLGDKPGEFLELKPGIRYRFSLKVKKLNGGGARLLVQGETMPRDSVSQLTLLPLTTVEGAERAILLLTKVLQLVQSLGLNEREVRYFVTHAASFGGIDLSQLPTVASGNTPAEKIAATGRFAAFLRLAEYARLKRDLAGGTDDLIGVFEVNESPDADKLEKKIYPLIAALSRRDEALIKATAEALVLAPAVPAFASDIPLQRLWDALQVVEQFGVPVRSLVAWTGIVSPAATPTQRFDIARDLKEAIKARFEPDAWQRVAQPIFDALRQRQRDALVAYVMEQHGFARIEQLYEYFLIDPGMEPVVQTSRIRLAIGSVQLFIQRCLLNMELLVHPSVINSRQWEWMKRYRVWEANRKIFLFPENWLEPEFRDDKTHLFTELEGALLQGDISSDLVEDAFLAYLRKLDELARLDIVAMHLEDNPDPARRTVHVIGRTYSQPHKYFYRRYAHQMWTPWTPVGAEIEGDHLAPVIWRDRLYLFWVTFITKPEPPAVPAQAGAPAVTELTLSQLANGLLTAGGRWTVEAHLNWCENVQGEWSTREAGELNVPSPVIVHGVSNFNSRSVFIHVSKETDPNGEERGVYIHMGGPIGQAFYLAGRNSAPERATYVAKPANPYNSANVESATRYIGSGDLKVSYQERITTDPGKTPAKANPSILTEGRGYTLLPCDNDLTALGVPDDAFETAANPAAVKLAIEAGVAEIASLMKPVFYQDNSHTLFVESEVTERTIEEWQEWVTRTTVPDPGWRAPDRLREPWIIPEIPWKPPIPELDPRSVFIDVGSLINPVPGGDWLVNPGTALEFDGVLIGPTGRGDLEILPAGAIANGGQLVNVNPGSALATGSTLVFAAGATPNRSGLLQPAGGLNIVGATGFNPALARNLNGSNHSRPGAVADAVGFLR